MPGISESEQPASQIIGSTLSCVLTATHACISERVPEFLAEILPEIAPYEHLESSIEIVLVEVLNNIVEHSYHHQEDQKITVKCTLGDTFLTFETLDLGCPMPPEVLIGHTLPPRPCDIPSIAEGGFGWFLIRKLVRDFEYRRVGHENRLRFTFDCAAGD